MSKLKDIPFGSEIPTFDNSGYITLSSGLKGPSGSAIIETNHSGSAYFSGEAFCALNANYASYASCAYSADYACCADCAVSAGTAECACVASDAGNAFYASSASYADCANYASYACFASEACYALQLSYCGGSYLSPSYCVSLSAYLLV